MRAMWMTTDRRQLNLKRKWLGRDGMACASRRILPSLRCLYASGLGTPPRGRITRVSWRARGSLLGMVSMTAKDTGRVCCQNAT